MKAKHDLCVWLYYENVRSSTRCDKVNKIMSKAMKKQSLQTMLRFTIQLSMTIISCSQQHTPSTHSTHFHKSKFNSSCCLSRKWDIFRSSFRSLPILPIERAGVGHHHHQWVEMDFVTRMENACCVAVCTLCDICIHTDSAQKLKLISIWNSWLEFTWLLAVRLIG